MRIHSPVGMAQYDDGKFHAEVSSRSPATAEFQALKDHHGLPSNSLGALQGGSSWIKFRFCLFSLSLSLSPPLKQPTF